MKRKLLTVLMVLLSAAMCFASGAREITDDETIVKVIAIDIEDDGVYRATVQTGDGTVIVYRASEEETVCSIPFEQIHVGSVLAVKDNGIMTMSIPAQMWATEIRDITLGVGAGAYDITFAEPEGVYADVIAEENAGADLWPMSVADDLASRFSYSYAYDLVVGYASQGVIFRGPYYVRGIMDFWNGSEPLTPLQSMAEDVNLYIDTIFMNGVAETTGPAPSSMDEIEAITSFEDISQRFSYAYGYASAYQDYMSGITVDLEDYVNGALTAVYGGTPLLDEDERSSSITDYVEYLSEQYLAYIEQMAADNLLTAENFDKRRYGCRQLHPARHRRQSDRVVRRIPVRALRTYSRLRRGRAQHERRRRGHRLSPPLPRLWGERSRIDRAQLAAGVRHRADGNRGRMTSLIES